MRPKIDQEDIEEKVKQSLVRVLGGHSKDISPEKALVDDLGMDSFASLELIFELEDQMGVKIADEDAKKLITVKDVINYIHVAQLPK